MAESIEQRVCPIARSPEVVEFLYPLLLTPTYKDYLWGGNRIQRFFRRPFAPGTCVAESWEVANHPNGESVIVNGPLRDVPLGELVRHRAASLLGDEDFVRFPWMLKYLDARHTLSVQVHPDRETADELGYPGQEKTEAWVVLDVLEGSCIWAGFKDGVQHKDIRPAIEAGRLEDLLNKIYPEVGDCYLIESGTVHALGAGVMVAEVQQTSDRTFRLFDWNRKGKDGRPRALHIDQGLQCLALDRGPIERLSPRKTPGAPCERLVTRPEFAIDRWSVDDSRVLHGDGICRVLTVVSGEVQLESDHATIPMRRGDTVLLPASAAQVSVSSTADPKAVLLDVHLP